MAKNADRHPKIFFEPCHADALQDCACPPPVIYTRRCDTAQDLTGDCACPAHPAEASAPAPGVSTTYHAPAELVFQPLLDGYETVYNPVWPGGFAVIDQAARQELLKYRTPRPLPAGARPHAAIDLANAGLLSPVIDSAYSCQETAPNTLTVWLHLTNRCNLGCRYCYVPKKNETMTPETGADAVRAVFRSARVHGFRRIQLKYAGGEPTLAFSTLLAVQSAALALAEESQATGQSEALANETHMAAQTIELDGVVLSNGVGITAEMVAQLREKRLRLSLSLDGWGAEHDGQRAQVGGQGSFELVRNSLDVLAREGFTPSITITLTGRNLSSLPRLVSELLRRELPFSFNFYRESGCSASDQDLAFTPERMIAGLRAAFAVIAKESPKHSLLHSLLDRSRLDYVHHHPCGVGRSYIAIGTQGDLSKCHMQMDQVFGHISSADPLDSVFQAAGGVQNPDVDTKPECKLCTWRYACAGGCPLANYAASGSYSSRSANCQIYQTLSSEVFTLEGLRLLRKAHVVSN